MTNPFRKLWRTANSRSGTGSQAEAVGNELLIEDRRVVARHFHPLAASVRYGVASTEERVQVYNFSEKGLCFYSDVRFPIGAAVEITTTLPRKPGIFGGRRVCYVAQVVRVSLERGKFCIATVILRCHTLPPERSAADLRASGRAAPIEAGRAGKAEQRSRRSVRKASRDGEAAGEGRQFSRYLCASQAEFRLLGGEQIFSGELTNLSLTGCYLQTPEPYPVGSCLEIVVQVGRSRIYAQARVKTVKEDQGMGVEFVGELAERLQRLPRFVHLVSAAKPHNRQNS